MNKKICSAGVVGSFSYVILDQDGVTNVVIRENDKEIVANLINMEYATQWTEKKICDLIGKKYEIN